MRTYGVSQPLEVRWPRFLRLLAYLPPEESIFMRIIKHQQIEYTEDGKAVSRDKIDRVNARDNLRKQHGRDRRPRQKMSLDTFLENNPSTGAVK